MGFRTDQVDEALISLALAGPARVVAGRFRLEHEAGSGGMGTVYRAVDLISGLPAAVKILNGRELRDRRRFEQEAAILAELSHPAIVRYLAHGVDEAGDPFLAMEWLEGEDLGALIARQNVSMTDALFVIRRAAEALGYAHARGIIHRDVKPENLFLPLGDITRTKVLDFGIARLTQGARSLTRTGAVVGTPGYLAPELVRGERNVTASADVFSLGLRTVSVPDRAPGVRGGGVVGAAGQDPAAGRAARARAGPEPARVAGRDGGPHARQGADAAFRRHGGGAGARSTISARSPRVAWARSARARTRR